jgi:hypothetical protein
MNSKRCARDSILPSSQPPHGQTNVSRTHGPFRFGSLFSRIPRFKPTDTDTKARLQTTQKNLQELLNNVRNLDEMQRMANVDPNVLSPAEDGCLPVSSIRRRVTK